VRFVIIRVCARTKRVQFVIIRVYVCAYQSFIIIKVFVNMHVQFKHDQVHDMPVKNYLRNI